MAFEHDIAGDFWRKLQSASNRLDLLAKSAGSLKLKSIFNFGKLLW